MTDFTLPSQEKLSQTGSKRRRAAERCAARKRGDKPKKTGLSAEQIPVLVARDCTGATLDGVLPKLDRISVTAVLAGVVTARRQPGVL